VRALPMVSFLRLPSSNTRIRPTFVRYPKYEIVS
jgi:hypothetical protein